MYNAKSNKMEVKIDNEQRAIFINALKDGLGLTKAAMMINKSAKEVTLFLKTNSDFYTDCMSAVTTAYKTLLVISNSYLQKKEFETWQRNNDLIRNFVFKLTMWEDYTNKKELTDRKLLKAVVLYKYNEEIATACGLSMDEFADLLIEKEYSF